MPWQSVYRSDDPIAVGSWPSENVRAVGWTTYVSGLPLQIPSATRYGAPTGPAADSRVLVAIAPGGTGRIEDEWARGEFNQVLALGAPRTVKGGEAQRYRAWAKLKFDEIRAVELVGVPRAPSPQWWRFWVPRPPKPVWQIHLAAGGTVVLRWDVWAGNPIADSDENCRQQFDVIHEHWLWCTGTHDASSNVNRAVEMSPLGFELAVVNALRRLGATVQHTGKSADGGVDAMIVSSSGDPIVVQCKRVMGPVGAAVVRDLIGAVLIRGASFGIVVATGGFTRGAIATAMGQRVRLVDYASLVGGDRGLLVAPIPDELRYRPSASSATRLGAVDPKWSSRVSQLKTPSQTRTEARTSAALPLIWPWIRERVAAGEQALVICPGINSFGEGVRGAIDVFRSLASGPLAGVKVSLLHEQISEKDARRVMLERFRGREIEVLVTTRWFGSEEMDEPGATMLIILAADRLGLDELLRLRERLLRKDRRAFCVLITDKPEAEAVRTMIETSGG